MKKSRKHYSPEQKVAALRRHLLEKENVSDLCDELGMNPTVFYRWQKEFFENGTAAFRQNGKGKSTAAKKKIAELEAKIQRKNEVMGELLEEHVQLKKNLGEF